MQEFEPLPQEGHFVGRIWRPGIGPALVRLEGQKVFDITSKECPMMHSLLEHDEPHKIAFDAPAEYICDLADLLCATKAASDVDDLRLLAPADIQSIKAAGVTFAQSMVERVIEEKAAGDAGRAEAIRTRIGGMIGESLAGIKPGSEAAEQVKRVLQDEGLWSQYLEVGIGPDAEIFTKCPSMAAVGWGVQIGVHPISKWNNPEPEIVLAVNSKGYIQGACLGNDVNLRDIEGRSALLLGKAKDNNASCAIGPFLRLFDTDYTLDHVRSARVELLIKGDDGFTLKGASSMDQISRDPADLVAQTIGVHHQYPDGFFLFLGTMFAPVEDREAEGQGFTHHIGDHVYIAQSELGTLFNRVNLSSQCGPWHFGTAALMRNLAARNLL